MGDSAMALGLYYRDSFDLDVEFPSGAVRRFLFPARFTVDQVKSHIFRTVDAVDEGLAADGKTKFDWVFEVFEIGDLLTVEFQRFMYSHIEIELLMRNDEVPRVKFVPRLKGKIVGVARSLSRGTRGGIAADAMELADNLAALVNEDWDDDVTDASIPPSVLMEAGRGAGGEPAAADNEVLSAVPPGSAAGAEAAGGGGAETRRRNRLDTGEVRKEKARHKEELKAMKETLYAELEEIKRLHDETMSKPIGLPRPTGAPMVTVTPTPTVNNAHLAVVQQSDPGSHSAPDARASHTAAVAARETEASSSSRPSSPAPTPTAVPSALSPAAKDKGKKKKRLSLFGFGKGKAKDKDKGSQSDNPGSVEAGDGVGASSSSSVAAAAAAAAAAPTAAAAEAEADQAPIEHASMVLRERTRRAMSVRHRKPDAPARESKRLTHRRFSWSSSQREAARATLGGTGASAMGGSTAGIPHFGVLCETEILELLEATQGSAPVFTVDDGPVIITPVKGWTIHGTSPTHSVESANASLDMREVDSDCTWYRDFFVGKDHINYVGQTKDDGPVVISIIREGTSKEMSYRVLFRSKNGLEKKVVPGSELKAGRLRSKPSAKEIVKQIYPAIASHVKVINDDALEGELQTMEERQLIKSYKVGLVYAKQGQTIEEDMFANDGAVIDHSPEYDEFLNWIGDVIELRGWDKYRAGLDVRGDTYGTHSVYTTWREFEVMFHVSTFLPYRANDYQQLQRKRHIGNDICVIIFMDGETPYAPDTIASQFNHVLLVVQPVPKSETGGATFYRMRMCYKDDVLPFGPPFPKQAMFEKNDALRDYIFGKLINGERHAYEAQGFKPAIVRTQTLLLKNIVETFAGGKN